MEYTGYTPGCTRYTRRRRARAARENRLDRAEGRPSARAKSGPLSPRAPGDAGASALPASASSSRSTAPLTGDASSTAPCATGSFAASATASSASPPTSSSATRRGRRPRHRGPPVAAPAQPTVTPALAGSATGNRSQRSRRCRLLLQVGFQHLVAGPPRPLALRDVPLLVGEVPLGCERHARKPEQVVTSPFDFHRTVSRDSGPCLMRGAASAWLPRGLSPPGFGFMLKSAASQAKPPQGAARSPSGPARTV